MTRLVLDCCTPHMTPFPSGWAWTHRRYCKVAPNQKVDRKLLPQRSTERRENEHRATVHRIEDARARVPTAAHPAGKNWGHAVTTWLRHQPGCDCWECQYIEAHLDDVVR